MIEKGPALAWGEIYLLSPVYQSLPSEESKNIYWLRIGPDIFQIPESGGFLSGNE